MLYRSDVLCIFIYTISMHCLSQTKSSSLIFPSLSLQNLVPFLDSPIEGGTQVTSQQQLQEQEKRIEISCALAAEASHRSRLLSGEDSLIFGAYPGFRSIHLHNELEVQLLLCKNRSRGEVALGFLRSSLNLYL